MQLFIDETNNNKIYLDHDQTCFIEFHTLPTTLVQYGMHHFQDLFDLHPTKRHSVINWEHEKEVSRWQQSYLNTPNVDLERIKHHSYMYSGFDTSSNNKKLDELFVPFYQHMHELDEKYNQISVNWYENNNDYIAMHQDCDYNMIENYKIAILSIYENPKDVRTMKIKTRNTNFNPIYTDIRIQMHPELVVIFGGDFQKHYIHGIPKSQDTKGPRISMSLRQMKASE